MTKTVTKLGEASVGDVVTLKSGSPPATIIRFVPADSPPIPDGIQNAAYVESGLHAQIMWIHDTGAMGQANVPIDALVLQAKKDPPPPVR
jgi:hypothetical protein